MSRCAAKRDPLCIEEVYADGKGGCRCSRRATVGPMCWQHDPAHRNRQWARRQEEHRKGQAARERSRVQQRYAPVRAFAEHLGVTTEAEQWIEGQLK